MKFNPSKTLLYIHPAIRRYREPLFRKMGQIGVSFLFTSKGAPGSHIEAEINSILKNFPFPFVQAREIKLGFSNFSFDLFRAFGFKKIIFSSMTSVPFILLAGPLKFLGRKIVLFDELWVYPKRPVAYRLIRPFIEFLIKFTVDAVIVAGNKARALYEEEFGVQPDRIFVARNTTRDLKKLRFQPEEEQVIKTKIQAIAKDKKIILYLGRLVRYKGLDVLIRAMEKIDGNSILLVVGEGPFKSHCISLAKELGVEDRIHFWGGCSSEEAVHFYRNSKVFVLPTRFLPTERVNCEAWGFTVNEAMSLEIPVVATTAVGAAYDLIEDGVSGMLAEEESPDDLAGKISFLLGDEGVRRKIGRTGRVRLMELCSYQQNLEAYENALRAVSGKRE